MTSSEDQTVKSMTHANRKGWDGLAETHYKNYDTDELRAGKSLLNACLSAWHR